MYRRVMRYIVDLTLLVSAVIAGWVIAAPGRLDTSDFAGAVREFASGTSSVEESSADMSATRRSFTLCHSGGGRNCVVDGDTFWMDGVKIRVSDIDAPETHPPRCAEEARLGKAATLRLQELLNAGPVTLVTQGRGEDRYGRALRVVKRGNESIGARLVDEGLARKWGGSRQPWC